MKYEEVQRKVIDVVAEIAGKETSEIGRNDQLWNDLGFDSVDTAELSIDLEEVFGLDEIDLDAWDNIKTVKQLCDYIAGRLDGSIAAPTNEDE